MIPYGRHDCTPEDIEAVVEVLRSDFLTQGPVLPAFERTLAGYCRAEHAVAVNSATSALHLACLALGLGAGDRLWTSPNTFVASANCALYCGAEVDFVDIDPGTGNMDVALLEGKLRRAAGEGRLPKVVVPVHFAGQPCDMEAIHALARRYGFRILEDASHALGATYRGGPVGDCRYSDICVFSFHPVKIITTAEGGAALTNDPALAERMALLRGHGITREAARLGRPDEGAWYYEQIALGHNYRMNEIQAALGIAQMRRLDEVVTRRRYLAARYDELLAGLPLSPLRKGADRRSAWHLYVVRLTGAAIRPGLRRGVFDYLRGHGIGVHVHYIPIPDQPYYRERGIGTGEYPGARSYYNQALTLPLFPALGEEEQARVVGTLREALKERVG